jgi:arylamine N-acetyltransferase
MDQVHPTEYLTRIGALQVADAGSPRLDAAALRDLHQVHQMTVPFENLCQVVNYLAA